MKECIIILACREAHLKIYDSKLLSNIEDRTKILIANRDISEFITQEDEACFDAIHFVNLKPAGLIEMYYDKKELLDVIKPYIKKFSSKNVTIFAGDEFNLEIIADVTTTLDANGYRFEKAKFFRDKALMKSYLHQHSKVKLPEHVLLTPLPGYEDLVERLGSPFVAKPVAAAGAEGVKFIHTENEWNDFRKKRDDNFDDYEAETFLSGHLFHVDSVRYKGDIIASIICEYLHPIGNFIKGDPVGSILLTEESPFYAPIVRLNKEVLNAFGEDGCFHLECFCDVGKEPVFLEIGWRQAGPPCNSSFDQVYGGCSQSLFYLFAVVGHPLPSFDFPSFNRVVFLLAKKKGVFKGLRFPELQSEFIDLDLKIKEGEEVTKNPEMFLEVAAFFSLKNSDYSTLYRDFLSLRELSFYKK